MTEIILNGKNYEEMIFFQRFCFECPGLYLQSYGFGVTEV